MSTLGNAENIFAVGSHKDTAVLVQVRAPRFHERAADKVVSSKQRPPLPPGNIPGTHSCYRLSRVEPQGHIKAGRIKSM
jgi:hypothetical protein